MFRPNHVDLPTGLMQRLATTPATGRTQFDPATVPYMLPNTLPENQRLDLQHYILRQFLRSNCVAPIGNIQQSLEHGTDSGHWADMLLGRMMHQSVAMSARLPQRILDVGCGTGRWAFELARQFPQAEVIGLDIVEPEKAYADQQPSPGNYHFQVGNMLQGLPFPTASFDYVHLRFTALAIPGPKWQPLINDLARVTAPGGWVESVECGLPTNGGPAFMRAQEALSQTVTARGIDLAALRTLDSTMRQSPYALELIQSRVLDLAIGPHGKAIGLQLAWNALSGLANVGSFFQQVGLFSRDEWKNLMATIEEELYSTVSQTTMPLYIAIGRRKE